MSTVIANKHDQLTVNWSKPEDDFVQSLSSKGADGTNEAKHKNGEENSLDWRSACSVSGDPGLNGVLGEPLTE